ncbi:hypothetical protein B0H12DRAFT_1323663 [Mycena haematopus]|nr:hypothetical protein B0H12DRAFT_1323663 [Mycena haematopus]
MAALAITVTSDASVAAPFASVAASYRGKFRAPPEAAANLHPPRFAPLSTPIAYAQPPLDGASARMEVFAALSVHPIALPTPNPRRPPAALQMPPRTAFAPTSGQLM